MGKSAPCCQGSVVFGGSVEGAPTAKVGEGEGEGMMSSCCHGYLAKLDSRSFFELLFTALQHARAECIIITNKAV